MIRRAIRIVEQARRAYNWPFILTWFVALPAFVAAEIAALLYATGGDRVSGAAALLRHYRLREAMFPALEEPGWRVLLDLHHQAGRDVSVTSACLASGVALTTALRHIDLLEHSGWVRREGDPDDGRRTFLRLTDGTAARIQRLLVEALA